MKYPPPRHDQPILNSNQSVRDPASLSTYLSLSAKSSTPLLTLFTAGYCPTCRHVLPLVKQLVSSGVGDDATTNGVNFAEVEFDAPDNMELGQRYMITSLPTLLGFDGRREEVVARLVDGRKLADKQFLEEWIWELAKRGGGGGGGGSSGEKGLFGGLFGSWKS
ncbi:uncharacterized protein F5Z01DRAFT_670401 [Emericellopsis atlantica]|uniref:Thioredoxin domain-containing protein n=1 Tax=Emericellopsis atlantica TaxID=2614577 RepID=A0A9P7ZUP8_9HYPO|nr:uncharacterized protein F5Z01DRAFT_670401 [Emericellopsis atlantica]KAG9258694.1 hypothetical protein F5Z01DRAFT_670401 [Emericellopsis atlantica]